VEAEPAPTPAAAETPNGIPASDLQVDEQPVSEAPVVHESPAIAISDEVAAPSDPSADEPTECSVDEEPLSVEEVVDAPGTEALVAELAAENVAEPDAEVVAEVVAEVENLGASAQDDASVPSSQEVIDPAGGADVPASEEVVPEQAETDEPAPSEPAIEEHDSVVEDTPADMGSLNDVAEAESVANDEWPEEQPTESPADCVASLDADTVEADQSGPIESDVTTATPAVEDPVEPVSADDTPTAIDGIVAPDIPEAPAAESEDAEPAAATDSVSAPTTDSADVPSPSVDVDVDVVAEEQTEPSVDAGDGDASVSAPAPEEPTTLDLSSIPEDNIASPVEVSDKVDEVSETVVVEQGESTPEKEISAPAESADSQVLPDIAAEAPATVVLEPTVEETATPAPADPDVVDENEVCVVDEPSSVSPDIADESADVPELSEKESVADAPEATPVVSAETEVEPASVAAIADGDDGTVAPEAVSDEPASVDGAVAVREIPIEETVVEHSEPAKESTDEPADLPAVAEEVGHSEQAAGNVEPVEMVPAVTDDIVGAGVEEHASETIAVDEAIPESDPDVVESLAVQDAAGEGVAPVEIESAPLDQDFETTPAAELQMTPKPTPVDAPIAEEVTTEDKPVDSEDVSATAAPISDETAVAVEPVVEADAPEPSAEIPVSDDGDVDAPSVEEPISNDVATEAADSDIAVVAAETASEQEPTEEADVATQPSDLEVVDMSEDKSEPEEPSVVVDDVSVDTDVPVAEPAASSVTADVDVPADSSPSIDHTSDEPAPEEPVVAERSAEEEIVSAGPTPEEPVDVAPATSDEVISEPPASVEPIVDTPAVVDDEPAEIPSSDAVEPTYQLSDDEVLEQTPVAEPAPADSTGGERASIADEQAVIDEVVTADAQEPTAFGDVAEQSLESSAGITADAESETDKTRELQSTVVDEPSLLASPDVGTAGVAAGVALAAVAAGIALTQNVDAIDSQVSPVDEVAETTNTGKGDDDDEGVVDDALKEAREYDVEPQSTGASGEAGESAEAVEAEASALVSEPEMIEYEGSNTSPSSPYEIIDSAGNSDIEKAESAGASPLVHADLNECHSPPVVVGTIEEVKSLAQEQSPIEDHTPGKDEQDDILSRSQTSTQTPRSEETGEVEPQQAIAVRSLQEPSPGAALSQRLPSVTTPDVAAWSSPQSQMSYNRTDSQLSISPPTHTPTSADEENARSLSKRDSAIYMDKSIKEASLPPIDDVEVATVPQDAEDDQASQGEMLVQGSDTASVVPEAPPSAPYSAYSTPAFPQYFSHSDASREQQQQQQVGSSIARRSVPRASNTGKKPSKSTRPKDVLMELNIETPDSGRQLMQLRVTDDLNDVCEQFCEQHNMMDLLPGMKSLVRGKIERRLARRQERALQTAAANAREKHAA
ncbi:hypothetical protein EV175_002521, partial [Coemansia sp. RSA 1933]